MASASFQKEFLDAHNAYRALHGAPPMTMNSELSAAAQEVADHCLDIGDLEHSKTKDGENIHYSGGTDNPTGKEAVDNWYSEIEHYDWDHPGYSNKTGHFTQVVWKGSTQLGVGLATDGDNVYVVGQYRPAGNCDEPEYFEENVLPKAGGGAGSSGNTSSTGAKKERKRCTLL